MKLQTNFDLLIWYLAINSWKKVSFNIFGIEFCMSMVIRNLKHRSLDWILRPSRVQDTNHFTKLAYNFFPSHILKKTDAVERVIITHQPSMTRGQDGSCGNDKIGSSLGVLDCVSSHRSLVMYIPLSSIFPLSPNPEFQWRSLLQK